MLSVKINLNKGKFPDTHFCSLNVFYKKFTFLRYYCVILKLFLYFRIKLEWSNEDCIKLIRESQLKHVFWNAKTSFTFPKKIINIYYSIILSGIIILSRLLLDPEGSEKCNSFTMICLILLHFLFLIMCTRFRVKNILNSSR